MQGCDDSYCKLYVSRGSNQFSRSAGLEHTSILLPLVGYSARCIILKEGLIYMQLKEKRKLTSAPPSLNRPESYNSTGMGFITVQCPLLDAL